MSSWSKNLIYGACGIALLASTSYASEEGQSLDFTTPTPQHLSNPDNADLPSLSDLGPAPVQRTSVPQSVPPSDLEKLSLPGNPPIEPATAPAAVPSADLDKLSLPDNSPSKPISLPMPEVAKDDGLMLLPEEPPVAISKDAPFQVSDPDEFGSEPLISGGQGASDAIDLSDVDDKPSEISPEPPVEPASVVKKVVDKVKEKVVNATKTEEDFYKENNERIVKEAEEEAELISKRWNLDYHVSETPSIFLDGSEASTGNGHLPEMPDHTNFESYAIDAAKKGDLNTLRLMVDQVGTTDIKDQEDNTLLIIATFNGHLDAVRWLLVKGAAVDAANHYGTTALHLAARSNRLDLARALVTMGANMYLHDSADKTPIDYALEYHYQDITELLIPKDIGAPEAK